MSTALLRVVVVRDGDHHLLVLAHVLGDLVPHSKMPITQGGPFLGECVRTGRNRESEQSPFSVPCEAVQDFHVSSPWIRAIGPTARRRGPSDVGYFVATISSKTMNKKLKESPLSCGFFDGSVPEGCFCGRAQRIVLRSVHSRPPRALQVPPAFKKVGQCNRLIR